MVPIARLWILIVLIGIRITTNVRGSAAAAPSGDIVAFIFGDSLAEVGNNNYLQYALAKSNYPWYGIDFEGGKATGRFTNGRTIGDVIGTLRDLFELIYG